MTVLRERCPRRFVVGDEAISVRVRESQRARRARIIVGPRRPLEVIVPRGVRADEIDRFLAAKRRWIEAKLAASREIARRPAKLGLHEGSGVWLAGGPLPLERRNSRRSLAQLDGDRLIICGRDDDASAAIVRWYRRYARKALREVVEREAERLGLAFSSLAIRDQRTRWGSCSRNGNLSFSWRLVVAPPEVLEYVVVHELCHLRVPGHGKPFWRLLESVRPGWQEQARWLREHGGELHEYAPMAPAVSDETGTC